jgi:hypothetical protein
MRLVRLFVIDKSDQFCDCGLESAFGGKAEVHALNTGTARRGRLLASKLLSLPS